MSRVVYRVLNDDGIQNAATGQRWDKGSLLEGQAITPEWEAGLLAEGAIEEAWPVSTKRKQKAKADA